MTDARQGPDVQSPPEPSARAGSADLTLMLGFAALLVVHAAIHVAVFLKAFQLVDLHRLANPIARATGVGWLLVGGGFVFTALVFLGGWGRWRLLAAAAVCASQGLMLADFRDTGSGTLGNLLVVLALGVLR